MNLSTLEESHMSARFVNRFLLSSQAVHAMREHILVRNHSNVAIVKVSLPLLVVAHNMKGFTQVKSPTSVNIV